MTADLIERLLANDILVAHGIQSGHYFNPDGPEAAKAIQSRDERIAVLEGERDALAETLKGVASRAHCAIASLTAQEPK